MQFLIGLRMVRHGNMLLLNAKEMKNSTKDHFERFELARKEFVNEIYKALYLPQIVTWLNALLK